MNITETNRIEAAELGAISVLLRGFNKHITDPEACFFGSGVLWCIIFCNSKADSHTYTLNYKLVYHRRQPS